MLSGMPVDNWLELGRKLIAAIDNYYSNRSEKNKVELQFAIQNFYTRCELEVTQAKGLPDERKDDRMDLGLEVGSVMVEQFLRIENELKISEKTYKKMFYVLGERIWPFPNTIGYNFATDAEEKGVGIEEYLKSADYQKKNETIAHIDRVKGVLMLACDPERRALLKQKAAILIELNKWKAYLLKMQAENEAKKNKSPGAIELKSDEPSKVQIIDKLREPLEKFEVTESGLQKDSIAKQIARFKLLFADHKKSLAENNDSYEEGCFMAIVRAISSRAATYYASLWESEGNKQLKKIDNMLGDDEKHLKTILLKKRTRLLSELNKLEKELKKEEKQKNKTASFPPECNPPSNAAPRAPESPSEIVGSLKGFFVLGSNDTCDTLDSQILDFRRKFNQEKKGLKSPNQRKGGKMWETERNKCINKIDSILKEHEPNTWQKLAGHEFKR